MKISRSIFSTLPIGLIALLILARCYSEMSADYSIPFGDGTRYRRQGLLLLNQGVLARFDQPSGSAPLYAFAHIFGLPTEFDVMRVINAIFFALTIWAIWRTGVLVADKTTGWLSALLALLSPTLTYLITTYYTETVFCAVFAWCIYFTLQLIVSDKAKWNTALVAGLLTFWVGLIRPAGLVVGLAAAVFFLFQRPWQFRVSAVRRLVLYGAVILTLQGMYVARNRLAYGEWTVFMPGDNKSLYIRSNNLSVRPDEWDATFPVSEDTQAQIREFREKGRPLDFFLARARKIITSSLTPRSTSLVTGLDLPSISGPMLALLALLGLAAGMKNKGIRFVSLVSILFIGFYASIHVSVRYTIGLVPPLAILGGFGLRQFVLRIRDTYLNSEDGTSPASKRLLVGLATTGGIFALWQIFYPLFYPALLLDVSFADSASAVSKTVKTYWDAGVGAAPPEEKVLTKWINLKDTKCDRVIIEFESCLAGGGLPTSNTEIDTIKGTTGALEWGAISLRYKNGKKDYWGSGTINFCPDLDRYHKYIVEKYIPANTTDILLSIDPPSYGDSLEIRNMRVYARRSSWLWKLMFLAPAGR